ncbi:hypothetical protein [Candidatus Avelusimicrobium aviculae]|uniref:hypothetical protein n=1 Tax=Candidatus Avelusimicrobium aviculae TaxID=3416206 RepID=UPI003D0C4A22
MMIAEKDVLKLMHKYTQILEELKQLEVTRTYNSPVGDYAEWLTSKKLDLTLEHNSKKDLMPWIKTKRDIKSKAVGKEEKQPPIADN